MLYFGYKFVKFIVELPTFDRKICLFSSKIISFYCPKTKFKHTLKKDLNKIDPNPFLVYNVDMSFFNGIDSIYCTITTFPT